MKPVSVDSNCDACKGHGRIPEQPEGPRAVYCLQCRGAEFLPTEDGKAIIGLVRAAKVERLLPEG